MEVFVPSKIIIFVLSGMPSIASSKVTKTKRGPGNETLKKRKERTAFYNRFQPSAGPGNKLKETLKKIILQSMYTFEHWASK